MRKNPILISFLVTLLLVLFFSIHPTVFAQQNITSNKIVVLEKDKVVNQDYFAAGETVTLSGTVNGDAYVAGRNVVIEGTINGDLITVGGNVNIRGKVSNDVRAAGGQVVVSGEIGKNLTAAGGSVEVTDSAIIKGSFTSASGNVSIFAPIGKGTTICAGNITIGDKINGSVNAAAGSITLTPTSQIAGNLNYISNQKAQIQLGALVSGETTQTLPPKPQVSQETTQNSMKGLRTTFKIIGFLSALLIGLLILKLAPNFSQKVVGKISQKFWLSSLIGFIAIIVIPIASLIMLITLIGAPLGILGIFGLVAYLYVAKIFVSYSIGQKLASWLNLKTSTSWTYVLGLFAYSILTLIPIIGAVISIFATLASVGALIVSKKETYLQLKSKKFL